MTKFICETKNLSKKYKDFYALKNVNLTIPKGEIYGLVGENGAGKTTLIRLLTGLNFKSEGEIILFGHNDNLQYERSKIGCTIEMPALYKDMTASQNLEVQRIQRGMGAFIGITLMLCVIFKHTAIVVGTMSLFIFSGPLIYMMTWDNMSAQSWRVLTYLKINPMYYWMNTCSYNMVNHLEINILLYFVGTVIITFLVSALILRKQEIH